VIFWKVPWPQHEDFGDAAGKEQSAKGKEQRGAFSGDFMVGFLLQRHSEILFGVEGGLRQRLLRLVLNDCSEGT
jgi:hypothetical protein